MYDGLNIGPNGSIIFSSRSILYAFYRHDDMAAHKGRLMHSAEFCSHVEAALDIWYARQRQQHDSQPGQSRGYIS